MYFERIKQEGLSQNSYLIGSGTECAAIDPRRDCSVYRNRAQEKNMRLKYIFETHRNEDFIIGSNELASLSGAGIYHGARPDWKYGRTVNDGQEFEIGSLKIKALATPGHTDESISYAVTDTSSGPHPVMVFTGDTLFIGSTGRVDLYGKADIPRMAANLYDSLFNRLLPLGDDVIVCPAHSAGSLCGTHIADRDESTLGIERRQNPDLKQTGRDDFIKYKMAEKPEFPPYFKLMEVYNLEGPPGLTHLPLPPPLTPAEFREEAEKGAIIVDTSQPVAFGTHIKGAYSIWLEGLPGFAGWLLPYDRPLLLVMEKDTEIEPAVRSLIRIGFDNIDGYLQGGVEKWYNAGMPFEKLPLLSVFELKDLLEKQARLTVLDVRSPEEYEKGHLKGATNIYVGELQERANEIPRDRPVAVHCTVGRRASIGAGILLRAGFENVCNVLGSYEAWTAAGFPVTKGK